MSNENLKSFLWEYRDSNILTNPNKLYEAIIKVEKDGKQSKFDENAKLRLFYELAYRYNEAYGLQTNDKFMKLPFQMPQGISFREFYTGMYRYKQFTINNDIVKNDNFRDRILRGIMRLCRHREWGGWTYIDSSVLQKNCTHRIDKKIYLSVDNKDLHDFALILLEKCDKYGVRYDFKINADDSYRRVDNVVIYTSNDDLSKYIAIIKEIKKQNPSMDFGDAHPLTYHLNDYIGLASEENGAAISHSQMICEKICDIRRGARRFNPFFEDVEKAIHQATKEVREFCKASLR